MTAPVRGTPRLSAIPASQNTAPVAEFRCLFTHDTRKKQKKWQDGFLKFHSFNSRVIVYDASRFSVGDTYYKDSNELHEGDELMLDKGVMVEVAEPIGVTQTDLTPLFERKSKDSPQSNKPVAPQKPLPRPIPASNPLRAASQLRHKSLNALLGASRGPIGKAVPIISPYEERVEQENRQSEERAAKRQKTAHVAPVQRPVRPPPPKPVPPKVPAPSLSRPPQRDQAFSRPQTLPHDATVISLSSQPELDNIPSDVTLPYTPVKSAAQVNPTNVRPVVAQKEKLPPTNHVQTPPKLPKGKVPVPHVKAQQTPRPPPPPSSPPVSASNRLANVDFALQPHSDPPNEPSPVRSPPRPSPPPDPAPKRKTKSLKLSSGTKRGMLLCQAAPVRRRPTPEEPRAHTTKHVAQERDVPLQRERAVSAPRKTNTSVQAGTARRGTQGQGGRHAVQGGRVETNDTGIEDAPLDMLDNAPLRILNDPELVHGYMDQQLLINSSPPGLPETIALSSDLVGKPAAAKSASTKKAPRSSKRTSEALPEEPAPKKRSTAKQPKDSISKPSRNKKSKEQTALPLRSSSPAAMPHNSEAPSKGIPLAPPEPQISRTPHPPPFLSTTGGFKKKPKKSTLPAPAPAPPPIPPSPEPATLPPHPLRSSKNGPLMSTTELSALLTHGPQSMRLEDDPIEDASQPPTPTTSPTKRASGLRRSRSETDAPIPSASETWEECNMPKPTTPNPAAPPVPKPKPGALAALVNKTDPRRKFARTRSLGVDVEAAKQDGADGDVEAATSSPPADEDIGPWSSEAFDLFDWKPPGKVWKEQGGGRMKLVDEGEGEGSRGVGRLVDGK